MSETKSRNVRVPDNLWTAAQDKARIEGTTLSAVINAFLKWYVVGPPRPDQ